ncbi:hypothetical protein LMG26691_00459 [Achromobacter animicus]|nr:hypothetical protein LMG26691_00459 [Achromobacter animicus]
MSNTMRPTKPGTLTLTSRPAKRSAAHRSARPARSDESAATSKPFQRAPAGQSRGVSNAGKTEAFERKAIESKGTARRATEAKSDWPKATERQSSGRATSDRKPGERQPGERYGATSQAGGPKASAKGAAARPVRNTSERRDRSNPSAQAAASNTDRLAKRLAAELPCSRGDAERYIEGGWVTVDGKVQEEPGLRVAPSQVVSLMPGARLEEGRPVTVLVHKPAGMYADDQPGSARDLILPENLMPGDRSGQRYLKRMFNGLKLVTPLERAASGLVVYSQEYAVARKLVEEGRHVEQEYIAHVEGKLSEADLARMQRGMAYEGRAATPMKVSWQNENHLRFALKSPPPGFIEAVCDAAGLRLLALRRLRIGRLPMAGLAAGQWRYRLDYERF